MPVPTESLKFMLADGATLAYDIFSSEHLGKGKLPIILIGGWSNTKSDWDRLIPHLSKSRPVLTFDQRGLGESTYSTADRNDNITIEIMARDLISLIVHVGWKNVDILGFSMGGVILQQLLLLTIHPTQPTPLPFRVHHALITGSLCSPIQRVGPPLPLTRALTPPPGQPMTVAQKKQIARPMLDASLGPKWVARPENRERYERWLERAIKGRPTRTILKQRQALATFNFRHQLGNIPPSVKILVIHGEEDLIVPFPSAIEILRLIPHARAVEIGPRRGEVPSYNFGHIWYEYFDVEVWIGVIEAFLDDEYTPSENARL